MDVALLTLLARHPFIATFAAALVVALWETPH